MSDAEVSTGLWLDGSGRVVESPPVSGVQLVAPGTVPTADGLARIERARSSVGRVPVERAVADVPPAPTSPNPARKPAAKRAPKAQG